MQGSQTRVSPQARILFWSVKFAPCHRSNSAVLDDSTAQIAHRPGVFVTPSWAGEPARPNITLAGVIARSVPYATS